jgi:uncharacterized caspase-like protein
MTVPKKWRMALAASCFSLLALGCAMESPKGTQYAIVYGVSIYENNLGKSQSHNLAYPDVDAQSINDMLVSHGYLQKNVILRLNQAATIGQFRTDVAAIAAKTKAADSVLFYFSGHGTTKNDFTGISSSSDTDYILFNFEGTAIRFTSSFLQSFALDTDQVDTLLRSVPATQRTAILDSCFSGGFLAPTDSVDGIPQDASGGVPSPSLSTTVTKPLIRYFSGSGSAANPVLYISAAGSLEESFEGDDLGHGFFTYFLLKSPSGADSDGNGIISASEAYDYARTNLTNYLEQTGAASGYPLFEPHISDGAVDTVLFNAD